MNLYHPWFRALSSFRLSILSEEQLTLIEFLKKTLELLPSSTGGSNQTAELLEALKSVLTSEQMKRSKAAGGSLS